jgi:glucose 1-dehydrogenase
MRAVITGAASGVGRAVAHRLATASERASLLVVDVSQEGLERVCGELASFDADVVSLAVDLASATAGEEVSDAVVAHFGSLDALMSNAGIIRHGALEDVELVDFELTFAVNTRATFLLAKALFPLLRESHGSVVATASISGVEPTPGLGAYSASKAALIMLIKQMACEWGQYGIRCNSVSPGLLRTPMTEDVYADARVAAEREQRVPLKRIATPEEIAAVVTFLLSEDARYVSGIDVLVDGGLQTTLMQSIRRN